MATSLINIECKRYGCMKNLLACYANCRYNTRCDELRGEVLAQLPQATADINTYRATRGAAAIAIQPLKRGLKFVDLSSALKKSTPPPKPALKPAAKPLRQTARKPARKKPQRQARRTAQQPIQSQPQRKPKAASVAASVAAAPPSPKPPTPKTAAKPQRRKRQITRPQTERVMPRPAKSTQTEEMSTTTVRGTAATRTSTNAPLTMPARTPDAASAFASTAAQDAAPKSAPARRKRSARASAAAPKKAKKTFIILHGERATVVDEQGLISQLLAGSMTGARFFEVKEVEARLEIVYKR